MNITKNEEIPNKNLRDINKLINTLNFYDDEKITLISFASQIETYDLFDSLINQCPHYLFNFIFKKRILLIDPNYWEE